MSEFDFSDFSREEGIVLSLIFIFIGVVLTICSINISYCLFRETIIQGFVDFFIRFLASSVLLVSSLLFLLFGIFGIRNYA
jgi:hypothetical protein